MRAAKLDSVLLLRVYGTLMGALQALGGDAEKKNLLPSRESGSAKGRECDFVG